ncbi:MAG: GTPase Era [Patescibacteria group bacterium]
MKSGRVAIIGRPNSGKSTLINNLVGQKISIISRRPQTTRTTVQGAYWDDRGQIIFLDTPGVFAKIQDPIGKKIAQSSTKEVGQADLILYLIDRTRSKGEEENRILGGIRNSNKPKIMVINKIDLKTPNFIHQYQFLEDEFNSLIEISALKKQHLKTLLTSIFELLPEGPAIFDPEKLKTFPAFGISPEKFIEEIIREKVFTSLRKEVPYTTGVKVETIDEKPNRFYIKAKIFTTHERYKPFIIGRKGQQIKEIGSMARKEIELITTKTVFLDLEVVTDSHWYEGQF